MDTLKDSAIDYLAPRHLVNKKNMVHQGFVWVPFCGHGRGTWSAVRKHYKLDYSKEISLKKS